MVVFIESLPLATILTNLTSGTLFLRNSFFNKLIKKKMINDKFRFQFTSKY